MPGLTPKKPNLSCCSKLPKGYQISERQAFTDDSWKTAFIGQTIFKPYEPNQYWYDGKNEILVFPRHRKVEYFNNRNLPRTFYVGLIDRLCGEFQDCLIRTIGTKKGAYDITEVEIERHNYSNFVGWTSIEDLIWRTQFAIGAVGSQSFPLKLSLLQGVPSFVIGHEKFRHVRSENWMKTRVGFYEIGRDGYNDFYSEDCIDKIVKFLKEGK
ncbi:MAG TPA: hypothetical protein ENH82_02175 [bacterium]|nr:hypothetical protein [bacterium]